MNAQKLLLGTLIGTVVSFIAGFLIFGLALTSYFEANSSMSSEPNMVWIVIAHLIFSFLLTYIFLQWAGISTVIGGLKGGFIVGLLIGLGYNSFLLGGSDFFAGITPAVVDAVGGAVVWAVGGAAIGWYLGRGK